MTERRSKIDDVIVRESAAGRPYDHLLAAVRKVSETSTVIPRPVDAAGSQAGSGSPSTPASPPPSRRQPKRRKAK